MNQLNQLIIIKLKMVKLTKMVMCKILIIKTW